MKKILLVFCVAICLSACNDKHVDALTETFTSDTLELSIQYPKNWEILKNPADQNSIAIVQKQINKEDLYEENIVCWMEEMPVAISDSVYLQATVTQLKISKPDLDVRKQAREKLGAHLFSTFTFDYTFKNNTQYEVRGFCMVNERRAYNFSCTALKKEMPEQIKIMKEIIATFKPL